MFYSGYYYYNKINSCITLYSLTANKRGNKLLFLLPSLLAVTTSQAHKQNPFVHYVNKISFHNKVHYKRAPTSFYCLLLYTE